MFIAIFRLYTAGTTFLDKIFGFWVLFFSVEISLSLSLLARHITNLSFDMRMVNTVDGSLHCKEFLCLENLSLTIDLCEAFYRIAKLFITVY